MRDRPLFIIGPPRTGSTLLTRLINSHPDVYFTNETRIITWAWRALHQEFFEDDRWAPLLHADFILDFMKRSFKDLIEELYTEKMSNSIWWGDKFPHYADPREGALELAHEFWPDALWISLTRDKTEVINSMIKRNKADGVNVSLDEVNYIFESHEKTAFDWISNEDVDGLHLTYENLVSEPYFFVRKIFMHWGVGEYANMQEKLNNIMGRRWSHPTSW